MTVKVLENTPAVSSLGKLCDEHGYSYEWINGQKPHLIQNGIRILCNTESFVPIVVPGLSSSSSGSSSTSKTHSRQESHSSSSSSTSSSSSSSSSSPTTSEIQIREREDATNSDTSPVPMSDSVGDRSGRPDETLANTTQKPNKKRNHDRTEQSVDTHFPKDRNCEICTRTKIARAPCRRRNGEPVPRTVNFGDLMTADHKNLTKKPPSPSTGNKEERLRKKRKNFATHGLWSSVREFAETRSSNLVRQRIHTMTESTWSTLSLPKTEMKRRTSPQRLFYSQKSPGTQAALSGDHHHLRDIPTAHGCVL